MCACLRYFVLIVEYINVNYYIFFFHTFLPVCRWVITYYKFGPGAPGGLVRIGNQASMRPLPPLCIAFALLGRGKVRKVWPIQAALFLLIILIKIHQTLVTHPSTGRTKYRLINFRDSARLSLSAKWMYN